MIDFGQMRKSRAALAAGAAVLVAVGATAGASAVQATRPSIEMAPTLPTPIAKLPASNGVITVKGRVAEVYGDRFVVQDQSGKAMIAAEGEVRGAVTVGQLVTVQGRYHDGQLRASYLVDQNGSIAAIGPIVPSLGAPAAPGGPGPRGGPRSDGPPPPPPCAPAPGGPGRPGAVLPPPPVNGAPPVANGVVLPSPPPGTPPTPPASRPPAAGSSIPRD